MKTTCSPYDLALPLLYADYSRVGNWWNFRDVVSPFYRLYLITKGKGNVYIDRKEYELVPGQLFLIPKFTLHRYECEEFMEHYYICFFDETSSGGGILNPIKMNLQIPASPHDYSFMERFLELNPNRALPAFDPKHYDNNRHIYGKESEITPDNYGSAVESNGILLQLFSRFITEDCLQAPLANSSYEKLDTVIRHIGSNLDRRISVVDLANRMCMTPDHFSRIFKRIVGMPPCEYIQMKRIERAQTLLLTSHMPVIEISEKVGIGNLSQFSRLFSKLTHCSPREYRIRQFNGLKPEPCLPVRSVSPEDSPEPD